MMEVKEKYREKAVAKREAQLEIYKKLFRGRQDVYPLYWQSKKDSDRKGYSPECKNRFKDGLCNHKCDGCPNQKFIPITDLVYKKHLAGQQLIGVYPLLPDNTCWFIAADLDNHRGNKNPFSDVKSFYEVCNVQEIPCYIEKSKGGKGYHAWIFFNNPIPAWKARLVVFALLKEAGVIGEDDSSFDRLFPNQDELSGKCLGNLIALPLWGKVFKEGKSTFLDKDFSPINGTGIGEFLKNIERLPETQLDRIIKERDLKRVPTKQHSEYTPPGSLSPAEGLKYLIHGCKFIQHCKDNQADLLEPLWYAAISNICRFEGGRETIHEFSCLHPKYTEKETESKIDQAFRSSGPITCKEIKKLGYDCGQRCKVKSPAGLGAKIKKQNVIPRREPVIRTLKDLDSMELPEIKWIVDEFFPEGLSLLVGKPKIGKSWLALQIALAVAMGGKALGKIDVDQGAVLYLGLEDTERRLRDRVNKQLSGETPPGNFHYCVNDWERLPAGGERIEKFLTEHKDIRLVVVDTLQKIRAPSMKHAGIYEQDYDAVSSLKNIADQFGIAMIVIHHQRKSKSDDIFDTVSGTMGITGAADTVAILKKETRTNADGTFFVSGRDVEDIEKALNFDPSMGLWSVLGDAEEYRRSKQRQDIINILKETGGSMTNGIHLSYF